MYGSYWKEAFLNCRLSEEKNLIELFWIVNVAPAIVCLYVWIRYIDLILFG